MKMAGELTHPTSVNSPSGLKTSPRSLVSLRPSEVPEAPPVGQPWRDLAELLLVWRGASPHGWPLVLNEVALVLWSGVVPTAPFQ